MNRTGIELPQVCYHPQLGPIETCDTCLVEVNGELVPRLRHSIGGIAWEVSTQSVRARAAQREAFDRILVNHVLYCTVCDNNNGNCVVHNTTKALNFEHQNISVSPETLRGRCYQPLLSLRPRSSAFSAGAV